VSSSEKSGDVVNRSPKEAGLFLEVAIAIRRLTLSFVNAIMQMLHFEEAKVGNTAHGSGKSLNQNGTSTFPTKSSWTHSVAKL